MAGSTNKKPRSNSLKADDEIDLYRLLIHASEKLKFRFKIKNSTIKESSLELRHQLKNHKWKQPGGINYDDMSICCAYLERYAVCHAALAKCATEWFLRKISSNKIKKSLFQNESLKVVCVGGGPGNDLLGFCSAIEGTTRTFKDLELSIVDLKAGWRTVFQENMDTARSLEFGKAGNLLEDDNVQVTLKFLPADLTCEMVDEIRDGDLILMVKVLSNVPSSSRKNMLKNIFSSLKEGAIFLYVDTLSSKVVKQANRPHSNMDILFTKKLHWFRLSIGKKERKDMLSRSSYEICVLQKVFNSDLNICDRDNKEIETTNEESSKRDDNEESSEDDDEESNEEEEEDDDDDEKSSEDDDDDDDDEESSKDDGKNNEKSIDDEDDIG